MEEFSYIQPPMRNHREDKRTFSRIGLSCFVFLLVAMVMGQIIVMILSISNPDYMQNSWLFLLYNDVPIYLIGLPLAALLLKKIPEDEWEGEELSTKQFLIILLISFALMFAGNLIGNAISVLIGFLKGGVVEDPLIDLVGNVLDFWPRVIAFVVIAPVFEELFFRKLLVDRLHKYGERRAAMLSGLLFALFHGNMFQFFYAYFVGFLFAYVYMRTRNILYPILLHMTINLQGGVLAPLLLESHYTAILLYSLCILTIAIYGTILFFRYRKQAIFLPGSNPLPEGRAGRRLMFRNVGMILYFVLCSFSIAVTLLVL